MDIRSVEGGATDVLFVSLVSSKVDAACDQRLQNPYHAIIRRHFIACHLECLNVQFSKTAKPKVRLFSVLISFLYFDQ